MDKYWIDTHNRKLL